jgi:hypothetical protein
MGDCSLVGDWQQNNKENWDWNNNSASNTTCQCMQQRRVRYARFCPFFYLNLDRFLIASGEYAGTASLGNQ